MPSIDYVDLFIQLEIICGKYEAIDYIRKSVTFDLLNVHDALENALNYYLANKKESISQINSVVNCFIARLLLADKSKELLNTAWLKYNICTDKFHVF